MKEVLVIDDTKNIRILLTTCLELEGYKVTTANNGIEALELLQSKCFELVFLDIKLPELSGTEVLRRLREQGIMTPVIIMTAFATVKNAVECTRLGAVAYLQKPFTAEKVRGVLEDIGQSGTGMDQLDSLLISAREALAAGKPEDAFRYLKLALSINPNCGIIYSLLAEAYHIRGNDEDAERFASIAKQFAENHSKSWGK